MSAKFSIPVHDQRVPAQDCIVRAVGAGQGPPVVLIAGWPQSLWAWRFVLPALARHHRVIALDLPGLGDSTLPAPCYDGDGVAQRLLAVVDTMLAEPFHLIGHDLGAWVSYPFAARFSNRLLSLTLMDAVIPGVVPMLPVTPQNAKLAWHFGFNSIAELPEALTAGRERLFLSWFYRHRAHITSAFTEADLDEYERVHCAPGAMASGFGFYRAMGESARQNLSHAARPLPMPVHVVVGDHGVGARMIEALLPLCAHGRGSVIENCGHYIPEEAPEALLEVLDV